MQTLKARMGEVRCFDAAKVVPSDGIADVVCSPYDKHACWFGVVAKRYKI